MSGTRCFIDANVLVSTWATDVILTFAERDLIEPRWSAQVMAEARKAFLRMHRDMSWIERYLGEIDAVFPHASVDVDDEAIAAIALPDPGDRHVVVGAAAAGCAVIVTYNLKDFPEEILQSMGIRAMHPDDLLMEVAEERADATVSALHSLVAAKKHPPRSMAEEIEGLRIVRLTRFVDFVEGRVLTAGN